MQRTRLSAVGKTYKQTSILRRLEAFFLDNLGKVLINDQLEEVARDPGTGRLRKRWHQRVSELRVHVGYTILTHRDDPTLKLGEYCLESPEKRVTAKARKAIDKKIKAELLARSPCCAHTGCNLREGDIDPIGGGKVRLQVDHMSSHGHNDGGLDKIENYQLLCGRHNVTKKNLWDDTTGKLNIAAILQFISHEEKKVAHKWLQEYFSRDRA